MDSPSQLPIGGEDASSSACKDGVRTIRNSVITTAFMPAAFLHCATQTAVTLWFRYYFPMSSDFKEQLRAQADIVRIVGEYVPLRKSGAQNYQGICPFHKEKSPSFSVHATRQFYHCFGCGESGDVFKFVQKIENITFGEAIRLIAQKLGVPLPKVQYDSPAEAQQAELRRQLVDANERACACFQE